MEVQTKAFKPYKMTLFPNNVMMIILVYIIKSISTYNTFVILIHANKLFVSGMDLAATYLVPIY